MCLIDKSSTPPRISRHLRPNGSIDSSWGPQSSGQPSQVKSSQVCQNKAEQDGGPQLVATATSRRARTHTHDDPDRLQNPPSLFASFPSATALPCCNSPHGHEHTSTRSRRSTTTHLPNLTVSRTRHPAAAPAATRHSTGSSRLKEKWSFAPRRLNKGMNTQLGWDWVRLSSAW